MSHSDKRPPPAGVDPVSDDIFTQQLREMNDALLLSSIRQHERMEVGEQEKAMVSANNDRLEAIVEKAPFGVYLLDEQLQFLQVSRKVLSVFGDIGELIGRDFVEVVHVLWPPDTANDIVCRFRHTLATGEPFVASEFSDMRYDRQVREYYDWQIHRITLPNGRYGVVCYFLDISARVLAEASSMRNAERLRFVIDSMPQKIMTATPEGLVDYFNPQWTEYTGLSSEQMMGMGWQRHIHLDDVADTVRLWTDAIQTGEPFVQEHRFRRADGEFCWHLSRMLPFRDADGQIVMWVGSSTDIHEQRQTANELRQYADVLSDADRKKNEFLAMVAHELRNPLAPIQNAVQVLRMADDNMDAVKLATDMLERQVRQMVHLVDDLLDVSRFSLGKIELRSRLIELASVLHQAAEMVESMCRSMDQTLTVNLSPEPIYLYADAGRLTQVFENLLINASKFTPRQGHIEVAVERVGEEVVVAVKDNGIGLSTEHIDRVFTLFVQVDSSLVRASGGLGIGLSLVKNLVTMHGGSVDVHSAGVGHGSTFTVRLPNVVDVPPPPAPRHEGGMTASLTARRILVVDDNRDSADSLAMLLRSSGNETRVAYDGLEAVEQASTFRPDVILLDIGLPIISGYDTCQRIRSTSFGKKIVIVALTGMGETSDRQRAIETGFDEHLVKPVAYANLNRIVSGELAHRHSQH